MMPAGLSHILASLCPNARAYNDTRSYKNITATLWPSMRRIPSKTVTRQTSTLYIFSLSSAHIKHTHRISRAAKEPGYQQNSGHIYSFPPLISQPLLVQKNNCPLFTARNHEASTCIIPVATDKHTESTKRVRFTIQAWQKKSSTVLLIPRGMFWQQ